MYGAIEQTTRRWRGGGRDAKLIAARRRLAEEYDREDHERDVKPGVPVAVAAAIVNASIPAEEEDLWGRRSGGGVRPTPSTRRYNYNVEDLAEDVGPGDRGVPVWKSDFIWLVGQFCFWSDWEISEARRLAVRQSRFDDASSDSKLKAQLRTY